MKIIFLDIDGVITLPKTKFRGFHNIRPLRKIINTTDAYIVISSAWRIYGLKIIREQFASVGIDPSRIIDMTPRRESGDRGEEIKEWMEDMRGIISIDKFVIIDDDISDIKTYFKSWNIVKTNHKEGLTYKKAQEAIDILEGN